jgi:hypothetical protein
MWYIYNYIFLEILSDLLINNLNKKGCVNQFRYCQKAHSKKYFIAPNVTECDTVELHISIMDI